MLCERNGLTRTYAQARKNITSISNGDEGTERWLPDLEIFDWSKWNHAMKIQVLSFTQYGAIGLMSVEDDAFFGNDFAIPSLSF